MMLLNFKKDFLIEVIMIKQCCKQEPVITQKAEYTEIRCEVCNKSVTCKNYGMFQEEQNLRAAQEWNTMK